MTKTWIPSFALMSAQTITTIKSTLGVGMWGVFLFTFEDVLMTKLVRMILHREQN